MPGENYQSWSVIAADNGNSDTSIEWREGQTRASVNNSSRAQMAAHAKNRNLLNGSIVTGGTANVQTFTSGVGYIAPIPTGLIVKLKIGAGLTNGPGVTTLNMDGIGDTVIKTDDGENIKGGELVAGCYTDFIWNGTNWIFLYSREFFQELISNSSLIIGVQKFTAPGAFTYTPTLGMECAVVELVGGGGGGGSGSAIPTQWYAGGGGGAGGYSRKLALASDIGTSLAGVVGAAGSGADGAPGASGGVGGTTSLGTICIANGGQGGGPGQIGSLGLGGAGGVAGTGDIVVPGNPGESGFYNQESNDIGRAGGKGGGSYFGGAGPGSQSSTTGGLTAAGYGSGGGGAASNNGSTSGGGSGAAGVVIITEFAGRGAPGRDGAPGVAGPVGPPGPAGVGTGDVLVSGTPAAGQLAQWTDTAHIKGIDAAAALFTTGDVKLTFKTVADAGWVLMNDGSIGNAASAATSRANDDTQALFLLLWGNVPALVVQSSAGATVARGASAAADFAAGRRLVLPAALGRALASAGAGAGLTSRALGTTAGEEAHTISLAEMPSHIHGVTDPGHAHTTAANYCLWQGNGPVDIGSTFTVYTLNPGLFSNGVNANGTGISIQPSGSGTAHNIMQPTTFLTVMIKL